MRRCHVGRIVVVVLACGFPCFATAQVSFGYPFTAAEACVDDAVQLGDIRKLSPRQIGTKARTTVPGWRLFKGTDDELGKEFIAKHPCMWKAVPPERCPDIQKMVDATTVGDSLGAKLHILFPDHTPDMRDKYAERLIQMYCPALKLRQTLGGAPHRTATDLRFRGGRRGLGCSRQANGQQDLRLARRES